MRTSKKSDLKIIAAQIIKTLQDSYEAKCELDFKTQFELLAAVILSAQCTDKRVNIVTPVLFKKYQNIEHFAAARINELEKIIMSTGFYKNKAANIIGCAKKILKDYNGKIPNKMNELLKLPGIGRKSANVLLAELYGKTEGIVVDTHVKRLSYRIGLTKNFEPEKIEIDLMKIIDRSVWIIFAHILIKHGRQVCTARKPLCDKCSINKICQKNIL